MTEWSSGWLVGKVGMLFIEYGETGEGVDWRVDGWRGEMWLHKGLGT